MRTWLVSDEGIVEGGSLTVATKLAESGKPFWLDVEEPTDMLIDQVAAILDVHPLAVEDAKSFGQRGMLRVYGDVAVLVGFGLDADRMEPVEVHAFLTERFLVTLHRAPSVALERVRAHGSVRTLLGGDRVRLLHAIASALHRDLPPCIERLDAHLGELATEVLRAPDERHLIEIAELNQVAARLRRTLSPGRELAARLANVDLLPGASEESLPYLRDISDDLHQIVSDLETLEDRCLAMLGLHASLTSNRQNAASRQLAVVATIFLPITFLVGFFGQNFDVLTDTIQQGWLSFLLLGVALSVVSVVATVALLNRRGLR
jgi:magnesium transporter